MEEDPASGCDSIFPTGMEETDDSGKMCDVLDGCFEGSSFQCCGVSIRGTVLDRTKEELLGVGIMWSSLLLMTLVEVLLSRKVPKEIRLCLVSAHGEAFHLLLLLAELHGVRISLLEDFFGFTAENAMGDLELYISPPFGPSLKYCSVFRFLRGIFRNIADDFD